jgi:Bacterial archaeo-eukaryotic release factor family 3
MTTAARIEEERARIEGPDYKALTKVREGTCISVYTNRSSDAEQTKNGLRRIKDALRGAAADVQNASMTVDDAGRMLESNWELIQQPESGRAGMKGAALFLGRNFAACYGLPTSVAERIVVGSEFFIRPLLASWPTNDRFFVLALSQKHVRLYEGSRYSIEERHLRDTPENLHEDLAGLSFERHYEMHTAASPVSNQKGAFFHGPSVSNKDRLIHFFRDVDLGVAGVLKNQEAPLIVAAVEYLFPIYKEANTYPHLLEDMIAGNPDLLTPDALHAASWKIVESRASEAEARAFDVYQEHINTRLTSSNLRKVIAAAASGRVRFLFIPSTGEAWGLFQPSEVVHIHDKEEPGDDELLNLAAILTLRHGGEVRVVPSTELPQGAEVAAVFRF